jgi:cytochrome c553
VTSASLLKHAQVVLDGTAWISESVAARAVAFLVRQALEDTVIELCRAANANMDCANMRSKLVALEVLHGGQVSNTAKVAWLGLCNACHHHAYELTPSLQEVRHLLTLVTTLSSLPILGRG